MNFLDLFKTKKTRPASTAERRKLLEHIENNASKSDFIDWLNNQHDSAFSESSDWEEIRSSVSKSKIPTSELHSYASSLSSDTDIVKLLKDVEEQTSQAQITADKLSLLSNLKKFAIATGGASMLSGVLLILSALGFWAELIRLDGIDKGYAVGFGLLLGSLQFIAGLLLVDE